jgi:hypothetical protein
LLRFIIAVIATGGQQSEGRADQHCGRVQFHQSHGNPFMVVQLTAGSAAFIREEISRGCRVSPYTMSGEGDSRLDAPA